MIPSPGLDFEVWAHTFVSSQPLFSKSCKVSLLFPYLQSALPYHSPLCGHQLITLKLAESNERSSLLSYLAHRAFTWVIMPYFWKRFCALISKIQKQIALLVISLACSPAYSRCYCFHSAFLLRWSHLLLWLQICDYLTNLWFQPEFTFSSKLEYTTTQMQLCWDICKFKTVSFLSVYALSFVASPVSVKWALTCNLQNLDHAGVGTLCSLLL